MQSGKGLRFWDLNLLYELNAARVASVSDVAARGGLLMNTHLPGCIVVVTRAYRP